MTIPKMILFDYGGTLLYEPNFDPAKVNSKLLDFVVDTHGITAQEYNERATRIFDEIRACSGGCLEVNEHLFLRYMADYFKFEFSAPIEQIEQEMFDTTECRYTPSVREDFLALDDCIRREYEEYYDIRKNPVIVTVPDILFIDEMRLEAGNCPIRLLQTEAPHTDDSTLIVVENEKVLFLGDAAGGVFPTWEKDPALCRKLADTIEGLDVDICLESHHFPQTKQEMIDDLRSV